jgi:hypothetical protein
MTKQEFLLELDEIVSAPLFIGKSESDIKEEIANNMWYISISSELASVLTTEDFATFIKKTISNRKAQVMALKATTDTLFYLWFDEQASQIRLNVVSDYGAGLPFGCKVTPINEFYPIIKEFLEHPYHDGIPVEAFTVVDVNFDDCAEECDNKYNFLRVYCVKL